MRKEKLEHVMTTGNIYEKKDRCRQREKTPDNLLLWHLKMLTH